MLKLALFDLDHTLLSIDSDYEWGEFIIRQGLVDAADYRAKNDQFFRDYQIGQLDPVAYNEFCLGVLAPYGLDELAEWHTRFMQSVVIPAIRQQGRDAVAYHRNQGHALVMITATNRLVTQAIGQYLGFEPDHILATTPEIQDQHPTGKLVGQPCFQAGKLTHLAEWLERQGNPRVLESWGYSDSMNDLPLLEFVHHPTAVAPDARLQAHAQLKNWPIVYWS